MVWIFLKLLVVKMAKRKRPITKHDIIRTIRMISTRVSYLDTIVDSLGEMLRGYVEFMGNEKEYLKFMEKRISKDDPKDDKE